MALFDLAHQIGLNILLKKILTVDEGVRGCDFNICDIGKVFAYVWRTSRDTGKWMVPFDSAHQIGLNKLLKEVLTVDEGVHGWDFKMCDFENVFAHVHRTSRDTAK